ncbi:MAG: hypothetical protein ACU0DB_12610 [Paracoccus sp. (in: a-proteobacteria)]|jgi:hypothetical protein|uniref:hypothetical protein n=1 Tax=unclassified Paracoccus (in: a-proteobacteria) TaxID=2688777 RepID=UPI00236CC55D|nr:MULTISPECIES: hypothetical protein [unclassified Paracoccus (in: a-proteobacteria)]MCS5602013.1 hypothetical protein [Paracoccus sp. (in: a-proteobacteria)]MDB2551102.1 hypothetical protein [Paracoccus sp. (in: a-proteobacteria)]|tara:strand:- start:1724 stop:2074 length:351 start_codon:yes stop_codon:yes gene_type:complete
MIGVVVWSNAEREKAVIWCEDHASLAYLQGRQNLIAAGQWPSPGDLLELETEIVGNLRHARNVSLVSEQGCRQLPQMLRHSSKAAPPRLKLVASNQQAPSRADSEDIAPIRIGASR